MKDSRRPAEGEKKPDEKQKPITYTVDEESYTTTDRTLTAREILTIAGGDVDTHYLVELRGNSGERTSYQGRLDESIPMHPNMRFLALSTGATTVS